MAAATLEKWVDDLQSRGRYSFVRAEAIAGSGLTAEAVKKALQRLARRRRVAKIKDYFFAIVPLEYVHTEATPVSWVIHDLMAAMKLPYYVGLLSAAGLHGASHQQAQEFQVVTNRSVRPLAIGRARVRFFASKFATCAGTVSFKTPTGRMRVSTPEATAIDLVRFARACGSLDNVATVLKELSPALDAKKLLAAVRQIGDMPNAQRLGFILDRVGGRRLAVPLHKWIMRHRPRTAPLRPNHFVSSAAEDRRWLLTVDRPLEVDA